MITPSDILYGSFKRKENVELDFVESRLLWFIKQNFTRHDGSMPPMAPSSIAYNYILEAQRIAYQEELHQEDVLPALSSQKIHQKIDDLVDKGLLEIKKKHEFYSCTLTSAGINHPC